MIIRYLLFLFLFFLTVHAYDFTKIYDQRVLNKDGEYVTGFFNIFDPSMDNGAGDESEYSFKYYRPREDTRLLSPSIPLTTSYSYYKFYVPESITYYNLAGVSYPSNNEYEFYISYSPNIDFENFTDSGSTVNMNYLTPENNPTVKVKSQNASFILSHSLNAPYALKPGWVYMAIRHTGKNYFSSGTYSLELVYSMNVDKANYDNWLQTVQRDGNNPKDPNDVPRAPSVMPIDNKTINNTTPFSYQAIASGTSPIEFELIGDNIPTGMTITSAGLIQWSTPQLGTWPISVKASNSVGSDLELFSLQVVEQSTQCTILNYTDRTISSSSSFSLDFGLTCEDPLRLTLNSAPSGMQVANESQIQWTNPTAGTHPVIVSIENLTTGEVYERSFNLTVNEAPIIQPIQNITINTGQAISIPVALSNASSAGSVNWSVYAPDAAVSASYSNGYVNISPISTSGTYTVTVQAFNNYTAEEQFTVTVTGQSTEPTEPTEPTTPPIDTTERGLDIIKLYVATFNRAPDAEGYKYWVEDTGLEILQIAQSFFDQQETQLKYNSIISSNPNAREIINFIKEIYTNLFNRNANTDEYEYWSIQIASKSIEKWHAIEAVKNGATGEDEAILDRKAEVASYYIEKGLNSTNFNLASAITDADVQRLKNDIDALSSSFGPVNPPSDSSGPLLPIIQ